jgi:hypothetical protein
MPSSPTVNRRIAKKMGILLSLSSWRHTSSRMRIKYYFRYGLRVAGESSNTYANIRGRERACYSVISVGRQ